MSQRAGRRGGRRWRPPGGSEWAAGRKRAEQNAFLAGLLRARPGSDPSPLSVCLRSLEIAPTPSRCREPASSPLRDPVRVRDGPAPAVPRDWNRPAPNLLRVGPHPASILLELLPTPAPSPLRVCPDFSVLAMKSNETVARPATSDSPPVNSDGGRRPGVADRQNCSHCEPTALQKATGSLNLERSILNRLVFGRNSACAIARGTLFSFFPGTPPLEPCCHMLRALRRLSRRPLLIPAEAAAQLIRSSPASVFGPARTQPSRGRSSGSRPARPTPGW